MAKEMSMSCEAEDGEEEEEERTGNLQTIRTFSITERWEKSAFFCF